MVKTKTKLIFIAMVSAIFAFICFCLLSITAFAQTLPNASDAIAADPYGAQDCYRIIFYLEQANGYISSNVPVYYIYLDKSSPIDAFIYQTGSVSGLPGVSSSAEYMLKYRTSTNEYFFPTYNIPSFASYGYYSKSYDSYAGTFGTGVGHGSSIFWIPYDTSNASSKRPVILYSDLPVLDPSGATAYDPINYVDQLAFQLDNRSYLSFTVATTEDSEFIEVPPSNTETNNNYRGYFATQHYTFSIEFTKGSTIYTIPFNSFETSYPQWRIPTHDLTEPGMWNYIEISSYQQSYAVGFSSRMGHINPSEKDQPSYWANYSACTSLPSTTQAYIPDLVDYLNEAFATDTFTADDLATILTGKAYLDGTLVYEHNVDLTNNSGYSYPPKDPTISDPTDPTRKYNPYDMLNYARNNIGQITEITPPDYTPALVELDSDGVSLFAWIYNTFLASPFGLILTVALTFILIRTVIW